MEYSVEELARHLDMARGAEIFLTLLEEAGYDVKREIQKMEKLRNQIVDLIYEQRG